MANVSLFRGGTPDFKPMFCRGEYAKWGPPFSAIHLDDTPPYDSHADAAYGQGWLTLQFPLIPTLWGNYAHHWMQTALKGITKPNDIMWLNWVPLRSFAVAQHIEVNKVDPVLTGVTVKPVAARVSWDWDNEQWKWDMNTEYAAKVADAGVSEIGLGEFSDTLQRYAFINLMPAGKVRTVPAARNDEGGDDEEAGDDTTETTVPEPAIPCTFGHNLVRYNDKGVPVGGLDEYYGGVVLGLQVVRGDNDKIAMLHSANFALYMSTKICAFVCGTQIG